MNREEAKKILERIVKTYNELTHPVILTYTEMRAIKVAIEATTAQKTGRWMKYKTVSRKDGERAMIEAPHNKMFCSSCGKHEYPTEYCPHCGAKMKGGEDESNT